MTPDTATVFSAQTATLFGGFTYFARLHYFALGDSIASQVMGVRDGMGRTTYFDSFPKESVISDSTHSTAATRLQRG